MSQFTEAKKHFHTKVVRQNLPNEYIFKNANPLGLPDQKQTNCTFTKNSSKSIVYQAMALDNMEKVLYAFRNIHSKSFELFHIEILLNVLNCLVTILSLEQLKCALKDLKIENIYTLIGIFCELSNLYDKDEVCLSRTLKEGKNILTVVLYKILMENKQELIVSFRQISNFLLAHANGEIS